MAGRIDPANLSQTQKDLIEKVSIITSASTEIQTLLKTERDYTILVGAGVESSTVMGCIADKAKAVSTMIAQPAIVQGAEPAAPAEDRAATIKVAV